MAGKKPITFWKFALALGIVAVPALMLKQSNERWAWGYTFLILLMLVVFYYEGIGRFGAFIQGTLKG
jgi:hypothetical protein